MKPGFALALLLAACSYEAPRTTVPGSAGAPAMAEAGAAGSVSLAEPGGTGGAGSVGGTGGTGGRRAKGGGAGAPSLDPDPVAGAPSEGGEGGEPSDPFAGATGAAGAPMADDGGASEEESSAGMGGQPATECECGVWSCRKCAQYGTSGINRGECLYWAPEIVTGCAGDPDGNVNQHGFIGCQLGMRICQ